MYQSRGARLLYDCAHLFALEARDCLLERRPREAAYHRSVARLLLERLDRYNAALVRRKTIRG